MFGSNGQAAKVSKDFLIHTAPNQMNTDTSAVSLADMFAAQAREIKKEDWRRGRKIKARIRKIKSLIAEYEELGDC